MELIYTDNIQHVEKFEKHYLKDFVLQQKSIVHQGLFIENNYCVYFEKFPYKFRKKAIQPNKIKCYYNIRRFYFNEKNQGVREVFSYYCDPMDKSKNKIYFFTVNEKKIEMTGFKSLGSIYTQSQAINKIIDTVVSILQS